MKKTLRAASAAVLFFVIFTFIPFRNVYAAGSVTIGVDVQYGQTEAREMLKLINDFRTATDGSAWQWNEDDTTKTVFNTNSSNTLGKLTYDYELEKIAMQRAAEIALVFDHTRPDGTRWSTAYPAGRYSAIGENLATGAPTRSMLSAFTGLQETDEPYLYQGHRRNMLEKQFNAVGIGHVKYNGAEYWVQEFGYTNTPSTAATVPAESTIRTPVKIDDGLLIITVNSLSCASTSMTINKGESADLPDLTAGCYVSGHWPSKTNGNLTVCPVCPDIPWTSDNSSVAEVSGGKINALSAGTANLTASFGGKSVTVSVTVKQTGSSGLIGDVNGDGVVDPKDLTRLMKYLSGADVAVVAKETDVNRDGVTDARDLTKLLKIISGK